MVLIEGKIETNRTESSETDPYTHFYVLLFPQRHKSNSIVLTFKHMMLELHNAYTKEMNPNLKFPSYIKIATDTV